MKKILSLLSFIIVCFSALQSQEKTKEVSLPINDVTLYLSGASINRSGLVEIEPGNTRITITGLSPMLDSRSIQVGMGTEVSILSVSDNMVTKIDPRKMPIVKFLVDSLEAVRFELENERNNAYALNQQLNLLIANMNVSGEKGVIVPELEDALALYRKELPVIKKQLLLSSIRERNLKTEMDTLTNRYNEFKRSNERSTREIQLTVSAKNRVKANLLLQYYVADAGWIPKYDLRSVKVTDPITLAYKAELRQNTGENWEGVKLTLSTNNPMYTPALPQLFTNFVELDGWYRQNRSNSLTYDFGDNNGKYEKSKKPYLGGAVQYNETYSTEAVINNDISFEVPFLVKLNADNQTLVTEVKTDSLPVSYKYFSVPKAECSVFLKAQITNWENANLLNGEANLYMEGTFLGKTNINPEQIDDTLSVYMGKDRKVVVKRTKIKEKSGKNFFGNKITQSTEWEIEIRNTKKEAIIIEIQDQIPVSKNEDLEVIKDNMSGAEVNEETGLLTWNKTLAPGETVKIRFGFSLKYPKNNQVVKQKLMELKRDNYM